MNDLRNLNVVLTGASRGIGVYMARALAAQGMNLALVARSRDPLEALAAELRGTGVKVCVISVDLEHADAARLVVDTTLRELGSIDVLINNAALEINKAYVDMSTAEVTRMIYADLTSPMLLAHAALPHMLKQKRGQIVNIASLSGKAGTPFNAPYSAAKGGLVLFTQAMRAELHGTGVSASVVCPGFVSEAGMFADKKAETAVQEPAIVGSVTPTQVARAVVDIIRSQSPEALVAPGPMRLMNAITQLFPSFGGWVVRSTGVTELFRKAAGMNTHNTPHA